MNKKLLRKQPILVQGVGITPFGELWDKSLADLFKDAVDAALRDAKLKMKDVDHVFIGNMLGGETTEQSQLGALPASLYGVHVPSVRVEAACASGGLAVYQAVQALRSGQSQTALVVGVEKMTDFSADVMAHLLMQAAAEEERIAGATFPSLYALIAQLHMKQYGTTREQLALSSVMAHNNACLNAGAQFQYPITVEQVMKSAPISAPLNLLDCSPVSDGAAAVVLTMKPVGQRNQRSRTPAAYIIAEAVATDTLGLAQRKSMTTLAATQRASKKIFSESKLNRREIDFIEMHDCFSIATILGLEDMGFVKKGQGGKALERIAKADPKLPAVNTSGGLKAAGHPVGATGVKQIVEAALQLRGVAGQRQLAKPPRYGLTHNIGGSGATCVMHLLTSSTSL